MTGKNSIHLVGKNSLVYNIENHKFKLRNQTIRDELIIQNLIPLSTARS